MDKVAISDILLDVETAHNEVFVSDDLKTASCSRIKQQRPDTPDRFTDYSQVLSTRSFSSGLHCWEVQISKSGLWRVGVCYPSMERRGKESGIGNNNKSWCLWSENKSLSVRHNNIVTSLRPLSCDTVRILLDYGAGRLTFNELCKPIRELHTFTATFDEPLYAAFWVYGATVQIKTKSNIQHPAVKKIGERAQEKPQESEARNAELTNLQNEIQWRLALFSTPPPLEVISQIIVDGTRLRMLDIQQVNGELAPVNQGSWKKLPYATFHAFQDGQEEIDQYLQVFETEWDLQGID
ncbi:E3 ubiquitin/ISG15 ligase TRIM25-like [Bombina bombina]|uniref:E3 ubiquitin/ISG15 ligase TRIM25-like n=1 Tax=Bombina bombina TaxID=8345 RepID=UPI00235A709E|nr:E3 ubiquitin/ISG15 ligase TRIM25-like [Bombina bombina]